MGEWQDAANFAAYLLFSVAFIVAASVLAAELARGRDGRP